MTETAKMADVVLPATTFLEHDDIYRGGGHQYLILGPEAGRAAGRMPQQSRGDLRRWRSASAPMHPGFAMSPRELIDQMLRVSKRGTLAELEAQPLARLPAAVRASRIISTASTGRTASSASSRTGTNVPFRSPYKSGPVADMPALPDHWTSIEEAGRASIRSASPPRRRAASSIRPSTRRRPRWRRKQRPTVMIHPDDARAHGIGDGDYVVLGNTRGQGAPARQVVRRRAPRRADRGVDLAEFGLCRRLRHQLADRRRSDRALWRRGLPRQQSVDTQSARG